MRQAADDVDPALPTVLTVHGTIDGATFGAERQVLLGRDLVYPRSLVALPNVDYVAWGTSIVIRHSATIHRSCIPAASSASILGKRGKTRDA